MEKKSNTLVVVLLTIIIMLVLFAIGLFYMNSKGYISFDNNTLTNNTRTTTEGNKTEDNNIEEKLFSIDTSKIENKNYDGTYGTITSYYVIGSGTINYSIALHADGTVSVGTTDENGNGYNDNLNTSNVVDLVQFVVAGTSDESLFYILTDNGDVYYYRIGDLVDKKYNVTKVENVSNVKKIFTYYWGGKPNAGGSWSIYAVTNNDEYIELKGDSV